MKKPIVRFIVAVVVAVVLAAPAGLQAAHAGHGPLCYVDMDAKGGSDNGDSWQNAYVNLKTALFDSSCTEIWVAEGLYKPGPTEIDSFHIRPGLALYGGFDATETVRSERDWGAHLTVLSGDIGNNDTTDAYGVVQDYHNIVGVNSYHVVTMDGTTISITSSTVLDGFIVTAGSAVGATSAGFGGGLYCDGSGSGHECSPTVAHVTFVGNKAVSSGGAMYNKGSSGGVSSPSISDVTFSFNHAEQNGGAIADSGDTGGTSSPTLLRVEFHHNTASNAGGAMRNNAWQGTSSPSLTDLYFEHNSATWDGGAISNIGEEGNSSPTLLRVTFLYNSAGGAGGAMCSYGWDGISSPSLTDVTFTENNGNTGGGMRNQGEEDGVSSPSLTRVTFEGNSAATHGGGMYNAAWMGGTSSPTLANVTFYGNASTEDGGAMFNDGVSGTSSPTLTNVTFSVNHAFSDGGAIYNKDSLGAGIANPTLTNVILWGDEADGSGNEVHNSLAVGTIDHSVVEGGCPLGSTCTNLIETDPKLALLTDNGGETETMSLIWGSSAIDTGDDTACAAAPVNGLDQRGVTRPQGPQCDMGAIERVPPGMRADFDSDGRSDIGYFSASTGLWAILESSEDFSYSTPSYYSWGSSHDIPALGDYDGDGRMDPTVRRPPAGGQSAAYLMLLSTTNYDYGSSLTVPAGWPGLGDTPVPGDYNGDGISDPAIWRSSAGVWIIPLSPTFTSYAFYSWGTTGDTPVGADVDGDGQTDIGFWRPFGGVWGFLQSSQGYSYASPLFFSWGSTGNKPVMADYDGDGLADPAVVIPPAGGQSQAYRILLSTLHYAPAFSLTIPAGWPGLGDTPVPGDYDGDGLADAGIWRSTSGVWIIPKSSTNNTSYLFAAWGSGGILGDVPAR